MVLDDLGPRSPGVSSSSRLEFYDKCFKILEDTIQDLGKDSSIFMAPVDPREVPDYFSVVKEPMDLGTIQKRLEQGFYDASRDFADVSAGLERRRCRCALGCAFGLVELFSL